MEGTVVVGHRVDCTARGFPRQRDVEADVLGGVTCGKLRPQLYHQRRCLRRGRQGGSRLLLVVAALHYTAAGARRH
jgi:hypothetical protein